jgi:DNA polymerase
MIAEMAANDRLKDRKPVPGEGGTAAGLVLIGEAPGGEEEKAGRPFVGKAGKNLNEFLAALGLKREEIYITNLVKVRPTKQSEKTNRPVNRPPDKDEIAFFKPFLSEELAILSPRIVVTLGNFPLKALLDDKNASIGQLHGQLLRLTDYGVFPLYHPASIIYNQSLKEVYQADLIALKEILPRPSITP